MQRHSTTSSYALPLVPLLIAAQLTIVAATPSLVHAASFDDLGFLGIGQNSRAFGISPDGQQVVGWSTFDQPANRQGFLWTEANGMIGLGDLPTNGGFNSEAAAVSNGGGVVVGASGNEEFVWTPQDGIMSFGPAFNATDVSGTGKVIVGRMLGQDNHQAAFVWREQTGMVEIGYGVFDPFVSSMATAVSHDGAFVVGEGGRRNVSNGWLWTQSGGFRDLGFAPGSGATLPRDVSNDGSVVVGRAALGGQFAFRWTEATGVQILGDLPGGPDGSDALAVSADGGIVVGEANNASGFTAFIWDATHGMRELKAVAESEYGLDLTGWTLQTAHDVSADGHAIVGYGIRPDGRQGAYRIVLPEPSTLVLSVGLLLVVIAHVRRRT